MNGIVRRSYKQMASNIELVRKVHGILREREVYCAVFILLAIYEREQLVLYSSRKRG